MIRINYINAGVHESIEVPRRTLCNEIAKLRSKGYTVSGVVILL